MSFFPPKSWSWWFGFKHNLHVCTCCSFEVEIDVPIIPNTWSSLQLLLCHPIRWWSLSYTHKCPFILIAFTMPPKRNMELIQHGCQHDIRLGIFVPISFCKACNVMEVEILVLLAKAFQILQWCLSYGVGEYL
jgi:hypothetical protein